MKPLDGQVALVTGASRGIGRAIAFALGRAGAAVTVNYQANAAAAEQTAEALRAEGIRVLTVCADVSNSNDVTRLVHETLQAFGSIDILVNNAGITRDNLLLFMKEDEWNRVLEVDLKGAFYCIKAVGREMARHRKGRIINIASDAGLTGDMMRANYAAAKAGLLGLTKTAARELAASGITVNAVSPGLIETDLVAGMTDTKRQKLLDTIPLKRFGNPDEVASVVLFLATESAAYITGEVLIVDGGLYTR